MLTWRQAWWFEYLSQFNLVIRFYPGHLDTKPDALTRQWDIYSKEGNTGYTTVNSHNSYGSLKQLPIPEWLWNSISMDFIEKLPSSSGFNTILVIVDWLTKQTIFIPAHDTIMFTDLAHLFILYVVSKHGISSHVISDRGSEFVSNFF